MLCQYVKLSKKCYKQPLILQEGHTLAKQCSICADIHYMTFMHSSDCPYAKQLTMYLRYILGFCLFPEKITCDLGVSIYLSL